MAAGVGKTYGMLADAHADQERGHRVAIGYLEAHGRKETENLAEGLEMIPLLQVQHRGVILLEPDLDSILALHPEIVLIDELAHTNAPGSRHSKRWQTVEEILNAGIDVRTTINIQHIESLRDTVAQITGVFVHETVPDAFLERADEIELVDIPPEELHLRLKDGKVYIPEKVDQALGGFFKKPNLLALRELALRHTAEKVDEQLRRSRELSKDRQPWHARERVLVCVAPNAMADRVVRSARKLANNLHADLLAVSVDSSRQAGASPKSRVKLDEAMRLAESLGARTTTLAGDDIAAEVVRFAQSENVTTIIVGKPIRARWKEVLFGSVVDTLIRTSGDIDVLVLTGDEQQGTALKSRTAPAERGSLEGYLVVFGVVGFFTGLGYLLIDAFELTNIVMLYLLGVALISARYGRRESVLSAVLSVAAFDFCFVHPQGTFAVSDAQFLVTFAVMLVVSLFIGSLAQRLKDQSHAASERERNTSALFELNRQLAEATEAPDMARLTVEKASRLVGMPASVLVPDGSNVAMLAVSAGADWGPRDEGVARWVIDNGKLAGKGTDTLAGADALYVPLLASRGCQGALAMHLKEQSISVQSQRLLEAIASQLASALERSAYAEETQTANLQVERERLRNNLLSSVSHDLRTPLASIEGSATSLADRPELDDPSRELATTSRDESPRMSRLCPNPPEFSRV